MRWTGVAGGDRRALGTLLSRAVQLLLGVAVAAIAARGLRAGEVGQFFYVWSLLAAATLVAQLGLDQTLLRDVARRRAGPTAVGQALALSLVVGAMVGALVDPLAQVVRDGGAGQSLMVGTSAIVASRAMTQIVSESLRARSWPMRANMLGLLAGPVASTMVSASLVIASPNAVTLESLIRAIALAQVGVVLLALIFSWKGLGLGSMSLSAKSRWTTLLSLGAPVLLVGLMNQVLVNLDLWTLGANSTATELAHYGTAHRMAPLVAAALLPAALTVAPRLAMAHGSSDVEAFRTAFAQGRAISGLLALMSWVGAVVLGEHVLVLLFGEGFSDAHALLVVLATGQAISGLAGPVGTALVMAGRQGLLARISLVVAATYAAVLALFGWLSATAVWYAVAAAGAVAAHNAWGLTALRRELSSLTARQK